MPQISLTVKQITDSPSVTIQLPPSIKGKQISFCFILSRQAPSATVDLTGQCTECYVDLIGQCTACYVDLIGQCTMMMMCIHINTHYMIYIYREKYIYIYIYIFIYRICFVYYQDLSSNLQSLYKNVAPRQQISTYIYMCHTR